jgi:hypothetical protein
MVLAAELTDTPADGMRTHRQNTTDTVSVLREINIEVPPLVFLYSA